MDGERKEGTVGANPDFSDKWCVIPRELSIKRHRCSIQIPNAIVSSCALLGLTCLDMKAKQINTISTEDVNCACLESPVATLEKVHYREDVEEAVMGSHDVLTSEKRRGQSLAKIT